MKLRHLLIRHVNGSPTVTISLKHPGVVAFFVPVKLGRFRLFTVGFSLEISGIAELFLRHAAKHEAAQAKRTLQ